MLSDTAMVRMGADAPWERVDILKKMRKEPSHGQGIEEGNGNFSGVIARADALSGNYAAAAAISAGVTGPVMHPTNTTT